MRGAARQGMIAAVSGIQNRLIRLLLIGSLTYAKMSTFTYQNSELTPIYPRCERAHIPVGGSTNTS
jgi:hypothetical protein